VPDQFAWLADIVAAAGDPADVEDAALAFDTADYDTLNVTIDGAAATVKKYSGITYVANPVDVWLSGVASGWGGGGAESRPNAWEMMNVYVPQGATSNSAIILSVNNAGWNNSPLGDSLSDGAALSSKSDSDKYGAALKAGYVVVEIGTRSRGIEGAVVGATIGDAGDKDGTYPGKAPAVVVDAKAAVRYLRLNDAAMPGSAERIVITGTSGGGGLSTAVAASGNAKEYLPYLQEIGAAGIAADGSSTLRDDVFGTIAYCPITDLNNADAAYEWTYNAVRTDANTSANVAGDTYSSANADSIDANDTSMAAASAWLKNSYIAYFNGLGLKDETGAALTTNNLAAAIQREVVTEIQEAIIEKGDPVPNYGEDFVFPGAGFPGGPPAADTLVKNDWFKYDPITKKVTGFDYSKYLSFVAGITTLKAIPAFDNVGTTLAAGQNETNLGGPVDIEYRNFSEYAWNHNNTAGDGSGKDDTGLTWKQYLGTAEGQAVALQMQMINPIPYLTDRVIAGTDEGDSAPYWYVRHGVRDRDTSFAVEMEVKYALLNNTQVKDANFELAWIKPHSGDYDVQEAYAWLATALATAGTPAVSSKGDVYDSAAYPVLSTARVQPVTYSVSQHFGLYSGRGTLTAKIDADFAKFEDLYYKAGYDKDGKPGNLLAPGTKIGSGDYTKTQGSTVIELSENHLNTYPAGTHILTAAYSDGSSGDITLQVGVVTPPPGSAATPAATASASAKTGDGFTPMAWVIVLILAGAGCVWLIRRNRKAVRQAK
ncbi:MAG: alpha/beta hydrolase fold domain-containing protein, partial [Clostridiales Family XIII bacterium]|jgi:dienelactone hydrolase|nr:alpha/beta hydrolase fold domain-containing protein [Clostridiales Family XIII bacterium]